METMITRQSPHGVSATLDRFAQAAEAKGLSIFARIDHAAGAAKVGESLPPTELLIFGSPAVGTAVMQKAQTAGIDLPLKALAWEADGKTQIGVNAPSWLLDRHAITAPPMAEKMTGMMNTLLDTAVAED